MSPNEFLESINLSRNVLIKSSQCVFEIKPQQLKTKKLLEIEESQNLAVGNNLLSYQLIIYNFSALEAK